MDQARTEFHTRSLAPESLNVSGEFRNSLKSAEDLPKSRLYSRFVKLMKLVLTLLALAVIALIIAWPHLDAKDIGFRLGFAAMQLNGSKNPSMLNPRYVGTDNNNQPFSLTADLARNLSGPDARVELEMPKADITTKDGTWLVLTAENGIFARLSKTLKLAGKVNLFHDQGYEFRTARAVINLSKGIASSNDPVEGQGAFGQINSNGFTLVNKGETIIFKGKSKITFYPNAKRAVQ